MGRKRKEPRRTQEFVEEKRCWMCKTIKPSSEFAYDSHSRDGLQPTCRPCNVLRTRKWQEKNKEKIKADRKKRYLEHDKPNNKARYAANKDRFKRSKSLWLTTVRGRMLSLLHSAKERSKKRRWIFDLDIEWATGLYERQSGKCSLTGLEFDLTPSSNGKRNFKPLAPSLDRIDTKIGYVKGNVRIVCVAINLAMNNFGEAFFNSLCEAYLENLKRDTRA